MIFIIRRVYTDIMSRHQGVRMNRSTQQQWIQCVHLLSAI